MRRYLLSRLPETGFTILEKEIDVEFLQAADEIFLTNALFPLQWVRVFNGYTYGNEMATSIIEKVVKNIEM